MKRRKYAYTLFAIPRGKKFGSFYHFESTSKEGAKQQLLKKYPIKKILEVRRSIKKG